MPIYLMSERTRSVTIPSQALALSITGSVAEAVLNVHAAADQPVVRSSSHRSVLPIVIGPLVVSVQPARGDFFGPDTVVQLTIGPDTADAVDPVQVVFEPVDVSGDSDVELATLTPAGTRIEIAVSAVADRPLNPLGTAARAAARKVVGRRSEPSSHPVVIAVDASASMRSAFSDGSVSAAADIVVGVADAVGITDVSAVLVAEKPVPVPTEPAGTLAGSLRNAEPRWSAGARWSAIAGNGGRTVVCTDFPTQILRQRFPVIAISTDPRLETDCAVLRPPRPGVDAVAEVLSQPAVLERIAIALVRGLM
ncbi:hypothetical protein [Mycobacterium ostraviense]|uniref:Uncharacterized protein n=1 Tax=Mycobacterium ostraviense TaxID=2738409 RepID=A0A162D5S5_9MYCO|nr:hypothetical protein [Mycobacterium ostraviense]KZS63004.1 hypothetical protein A4G28_26310 [Mycobacterium ostraviense]UGT93766.1 hypothetical protein LTS72_11385 [Mycobacterium ostraviense]